MIMLTINLKSSERDVIVCVVQSWQWITKVTHGSPQVTFESCASKGVSSQQVLEELSVKIMVASQICDFNLAGI